MRRWLLLGFFCALPVWPQPSVFPNNGVRNAASNAEGQAVSAGALISIYGSNLAAELAQASTVPLTTALGDVSVMVNNVAAPLLFVSGGQINAQLPWSASTQSVVDLVVRRGSNTSPAARVNVAPFSPGIFSVQFGIGQAIAIHVDGALVAPAGSIQGLNTRPARAGDTIVIYCTGLGPVDPPIRDGSAPVFEPNPQLHRTTTTPTVLIGGMEARVEFSGLTPQFTGVYQLNVVVPQGVPTGNTVPLQLRMGGITTTNQVTIAVQ